MQTPDINVLVNAFRPDAAQHARARSWLERTRQSAGPFAVAEFVLAAFVRIVTNRRAFADPAPLEPALAFCVELTEQDNCVLLRSGDRHWNIFMDLCQRANARGDLVPDAYLAALAIEHGCEFVTFDRGFGRYPGLRWSTPAD